MECGEARGLLADYSAENLEEAARRRVAEHLEGCGECRGHLAGLVAAGRLVAKMESVEPPAEIWQKILARGERPFPVPPQVAARRFRWALGSALGAIALFILSVSLSLYYLSPRPPEAALSLPTNTVALSGPAAAPAGLAGYFHQHAATATEDGLEDPVSLGLVMFASERSVEPAPQQGDK